MKYKCDNCGKRFEKVRVVIECSDCYVKGWKKQWKKERKFNELIEEGEE